MLTFCCREISLTINFKYRIILDWYETDRIVYHNLKSDLSLNVLSDEEMNSLWIPYVVFSNTNDNEATKVNHKFKDIETTMAVTREGDFTRSTLDTVDEIEIFKAAFNIIQQSNHYTQDK